MKYLFILGRNIELSTAEVLAFLQRFDNPATEFDIKENGLLVDVDKPLMKDAVNYLGGTIAIGEVLVDKKFEENIEPLTLYGGTKNHFNYCIWNFASEAFIDKIRTYFKARFKIEKLKATEKHLNGKITLQDGRQVDIIGTKFIEEKFFLFENEEKKKKYFGRIIQYCDYDELEKRDMGKPVRREDLAISPRLSKILINLSLVKEGPVLDAFCGIGGVLFESLLQNIPVIGIDRDGDAIEGAKQNMVWGKFDKRNYQLIYNDSKKVRIQGAEVMASEPDLGQKRTKVPMLEVIKEQTTQFENLMIAVLNNFKPQVSGRFAFTAPYILTQQRGKRVGCDVLRIAEATGLKLVAGFPIKEFREDQIVAREIVVLEH